MQNMNIKIKNFLILLLAVAFILAGCSSGNALEADDQIVMPALTVSPSPSPSETPSEPSKTPEASPSPSETAKAENYFTDEEKVTANEKDGHWQYSSPVLYVDIQRIFDKKKVITYYLADVRVKDSEQIIPGFANPKKPGVAGSWKPLYQIVRAADAVLAVNSDYMTKNKEIKGIIIRNGKVFNEKEKADALAFMPDGTIKIVENGETTAQELLDAGVKNTFSFGPTLLTDSKIDPNLNKHPLRPKNPRTAIGMVEPYHYILMVVDGRQKGYSVGVTLQELAELFEKYHCSVAYNLDGGQSSTMSFMGKNINKYGGSTTGQRSVPDALMFGKSDKVPN